MSDYQLKFNIYQGATDSKSGHANVTFINNIEGTSVTIGLNVNASDNAQNPLMHISPNYVTTGIGIVAYEQEDEDDQSPNAVLTINVTEEQWNAAYLHAQDRRVASVTGEVLADGRDARSNAPYHLVFSSCVTFAQDIWKVAGQSGHFMQEFPYINIL
jgi:hypothetical protein